MEVPNAELRESRDRYRALFETIDEGFCIIEKIDDAAGDPLDFRYVEANPAFEVQSGIAGVVGKTIRQVVPGEDEEWFRAYDTVLRTGVPIRFERGLVTQGRVLELFAFRIDQGSGRQVGVMFKNITDRKTLEAVQHDSEVRYRRLFESAKDGILILDYASGRILDANPFMGELLTCPVQAFCGKELWEIGLFKDKAASEAAVRQMREIGYVRFDHLPLQSTDGRRVEVEVVGNAYQEGSHNVMQCNVRDISERIALERMTRVQADALADLHRRKDEFLAMLSHELRTPLAPIASAVRMVRLHATETPLQQQALQIIERQLGQLTHLIDDLLEVSRITTGKVNLRKAPVVVSSIVDRAVEAVLPLMDARKHRFEVSLPPEPIWVDGDAARLEQVLVNLLTNAAKYTDDGGRLLLTVKQEAGMAVLQISDSGVGIAPALLSSVFDLFMQADRSLDRAQGGLGIGLCLVRQLVELHGGTVDAESVVGQGSTFVVRLPVTTSRPAAALGNAIADQPARQSCRILVVDDSVDTAQSLAMLLRASGHQVRISYDGHAALAEVRNDPPEVVLMDIGLPGLDGYEVAQRIREQPALRGTVLIAMTGYGQDADVKRSHDAGFNAHLVKPADFAELERILATVTADVTSESRSTG